MAIPYGLDAHWTGLQSPDRNHDPKPVAAPAVPSGAKGPVGKPSYHERDEARGLIMIRQGFSGDHNVGSSISGRKPMAK